MHLRVEDEATQVFTCSRRSKAFFLSYGRTRDSACHEHAACIRVVLNNSAALRSADRIPTGHMRRQNHEQEKKRHARFAISY